MRCFFQVLPHINAFFRDAQRTLAGQELQAMLISLGCPSGVEHVCLGGADFFAFEAPDGWDAGTRGRLAKHSAMLMLAEDVNGLLRPLDYESPDSFPRDMAEILKYKGKTNGAFTRMLLNLAAAAAGLTDRERLTVLDPMCGKGTTCWCALSEGHHAVGMDLDRKDLSEAMDFFRRYCERARWKLTLKQGAETCGNASVPSAVFTAALDREHQKENDTQQLRFYQTDSVHADKLMKKHPADLLVTDLPYGVQHAPQSGKKPESFEHALGRLLPSWHGALRTGGAAALSFNSLTLKRDTLCGLLRQAGFEPLEEAPYHSFSHFVEQAVTRDAVIALRR